MDRTDQTELTNHTQPEDLEESRRQTEEAAASAPEPATEAASPTESDAEARVETQAEAQVEAVAEAQEEIQAETPVEAGAEALEELPEEPLTESLEEAGAEVSEEAQAEALEEALEEALGEAPVEARAEALEEPPEEPLTEPLEEAGAEVSEEAPVEAQAEALEEALEEAPVETQAEAQAEALEEARGEVLAETAEEAAPEMSDLETMSELYEESLRRVQEGEVVKGRIVSITKEFVMVDIGYKSEGQIPIHEFTTPEGEITAQVGEEVEALMESREDEEGALLLSKNKASKIKVWEEVSYAYHHDGDVLGTVVAKVKGGLSVDLGGIIAFLPGSQVDLSPMRHTDHLIGQRLNFQVLKFNRKRRNVVLSRRALLEKAKSEAKATLLATLEEDKVLEGVVKNITDYGIFVDLGGLDGLLHITDLSYGRVRHPADLFKVGDPITVKVLNFDREKERISLGLKQLTADPWSLVDEKYPIGSRVTGRVVSLTDYGSFVELEPGVEGLIHISEMSWTRKIRHPSQVLTVSDMVECTVLELEPQRKRISLSLKQVEPNPWEVIGEKYPVGSVIEGKIKNITDFGIFIGIDEGIDGLVHISDISWTKRFKHPSELYKKGQVVQAKVLYIDKDNERFSLSIKDLAPNPWQTIDQRFPVGAAVSGPVTNITDFGLFVEVEEGIEGLIHISELGRDKQKMAALKVGDVIRAKVIHSSPQERRIGLSIRKLETDEEQSHYRDYLHSRTEATSNLGEILRETLEEKQSKNNG
jgi:small subunit ribosomal protein S1